MRNLTQAEISDLFSPPDVEKLLLEMVELDKAISGAKDDAERLRLLSASYLKDKRQSIHLQLAMYRHYEKSDKAQAELLKTLTEFKTEMQPVLEAFSDGKIVRAYSIFFAKGLILIGATITAFLGILHFLKQLLK